MYAWLWKRLPGSLPVRILLCALAAAAVVAALFLWVFPWAEPRLPFTDVTVDSAPARSSTGSSTGVDRITSM